MLGGGAIGGFFAPQIVSAAVLGCGRRLADRLDHHRGRGAGRGRPLPFLQSATGLRTWDNTRTACRPDQAKTTVGATSEGRNLPHDGRVDPRRCLENAGPLADFVLAAIGTFSLWQVLVTQGSPASSGQGASSPSTAAFFYSLAIGLSIVGRFSVAALGDIIEPRFIFAFAILCMLIGGALFLVHLPRRHVGGLSISAIGWLRHGRCLYLRGDHGWQLLGTRALREGSEE